MLANMTISKWLEYHGLQWVDGREQMYKSTFGVSEAKDIIQQLKAEGAVEDNG